jgi:hypothetical protein
VASGRNKRKRGKKAVTGAKDPWSRWFAEKLIVPVLAAAIGMGGGVYGAEKQAHAHHCEPSTVTMTTTTRAPSGKITKTISKQVTSCQKP